MIEREEIQFFTPKKLIINMRNGKKSIGLIILPCWAGQLFESRPLGNINSSMDEKGYRTTVSLYSLEELAGSSII